MRSDSEVKEKNLLGTISYQRGATDVTMCKSTKAVSSNTEFITYKGLRLRLRPSSTICHFIYILMFMVSGYPEKS